MKEETLIERSLTHSNFKTIGDVLAKNIMLAT